MLLISPSSLPLAIACLKAGGVVVYPTETSYGIGCDATNAEAVLRVFVVKNRPQWKGLTVLLPKEKTPESLGYIVPDSMRPIMEKYWPGPLNIVFAVDSSTTLASQCLTSSTVAMRRSSHPVANALVDALGVPLVSTSANISTEPELFSATDIFNRFANEPHQPDFIIDGGVLPTCLLSTLIAVNESGEVTVLRQGDVRIDQQKSKTLQRTT